MITSVEDFGQYIGRLARTDPEKARKRLALGYKLFGYKLRMFPDKRLPEAKRQSAIDLNRIMRKAFETPENLALVNIFMPCELLIAMGLNPICAELFSGFINGAASEQVFTEEAHREGIAETFCSYHKVVLGTAYTKVLPKPKAILNTSFVCDANQVTFRELSRTLDVPSYYVDVPNDRSEEAIQYVAHQLYEAKLFLEDITGRKLAEDALKETIRRADKTIRLYRKILLEKRNKDVPSDITSEMYEIYLMHNALGSKMSLDYTQGLLNAYQKAPKRTGKKILWLHTIPNGQEPVRKFFNFNPRYQILVTDINTDALIPLNPEAPYESMAKRLLLSTWNGGQNRVDAAVRLAKMLDADGVIGFSQWGCKQTMGLIPLFQEAFEEARIPFLALDGDGVDRKNVSDGQTATRLGAFLELLEGEDYAG